MPSLSEELKILITADPEKFDKAMERLQEQTKRLEAGLSVAAKASGVAFAALTGTVVASVAAFRDQERQEQKVTAQLRATGNAVGYTANEIFKMASELQDLTVYGDEVVMSAQSMLLGFDKIGKETFPKAQMAAANLATFLGTDLSSAAMQLGKALNDPAEGLTALGRAGIKFTDEQERMISALARSGQTAAAQAIILQILEGRIGGMAEAAAGGSGRFLQLKNAMGDVVEELGRAFTPAVEAASEALIPFFKSLAANESLIKTAAAVIAIGAGVSGLTLTFAAAGLAILKWNAVMRAANLSALALTFSIRGLLGATGIGLAVVLITDLALNWERRTMQMSAAWQAFVMNISKAGSALGDVLLGIATGNIFKIRDGLVGLKNTASSFADDYSKIFDEAMKKQEAAAKQDETVKNDKDAKRKLTASETEYLEMKKKLNEDYEKERAIAQLTGNQAFELAEMEHRNKLVELANQYRAAEVEARISDQQLDAEQELAYQTQVTEMRNQLRAEEMNLERATALETMQIKKNAHIQYLKDRQKFGEAYAKINQAMHAQEVAGFASATSELVALTQSKNATLKTIGKVAAVADITIQTARAAMNIYAGFSTIPIIGPALGVAGAAAAIAFGAERIAQVTAAADGGVITGGRQGRDSVPAMLMPGELVTPTRNFDEVVNAVANSRLQEQGLGGGGGGSQEVIVTIGFSEDAFRIIEQKLVERRALGV